MPTYTGNREQDKAQEINRSTLSSLHALQNFMDGHIKWSERHNLPVTPNVQSMHLDTSRAIARIEKAESQRKGAPHA